MIVTYFVRLVYRLFLPEPIPGLRLESVIRIDHGFAYLDPNPRGIDIAQEALFAFCVCMSWYAVPYFDQ